MSFKPSLPFATPAQILTAEFRKVNGVNVKTLVEGATIFVSAKSYGGTERTINDEYAIVDTMVIQTWYHPDITSSSLIKLLDDNSVWEIMNTPEDIDRRHQFMTFKVRRYAGQA